LIVGFFNYYDKSLFVFETEIGEHQLKYLIEYLNINWLGYDFIDLVCPRLLYEFFLNMTSNSNNHGLWNLIQSIKVTDLFGQLKSIHNGHADIGENHGINMLSILKSFFDF